jgi:hypothetical protein
MSASKRPTRAPRSARPAARLTATVDLPTPPLPEATATTFLTPGRTSVSARSLGLQYFAYACSDVVLVRRIGGAQCERDGDSVAVDVEVVDEAEGDDVVAECGVLDGFEQLEDVVFVHACG